MSMNVFALNLETYAIVFGISFILLALLFKRLTLSLAKHPSLAGHSKLSRQFAKFVPFYEFKDDAFFSCDHPPQAVITARQQGFKSLSQYYNEHFKKGFEMASQVKHSISDMQFVSTYRVPFQYSQYVNQHLKFGNFVKSSTGVSLTDVDDNIIFDLVGFYGVNVLCNDFYKACIEQCSALVLDLGPVLGPYHPLII